MFFLLQIFVSDVSTSLLHCITISKLVYCRVINMADVICPASIIILNSFYFNPPLFPQAEISDNLHASLNMFSAEEHYVSFPVI